MQIFSDDINRSQSQYHLVQQLIRALHATHTSMDLSGFSINSVHMAGRVSQVTVRLQGDSVYGSINVFGSVNDIIGIVINDSEVEGS